MSDEISNLKHALAVAETWVEHHQNHCDDLIKENAALRSLLQDSLEWLDDYGMRMSGTSNLVSRIETVLRKEAQP